MEPNLLDSNEKLSQNHLGWNAKIYKFLTDTVYAFVVGIGVLGPQFIVSSE